MLRKLWAPSPFCHARANSPLDMIVVHHIGSKNSKLYSASGAITWFIDEEVHRNKDTGKIENKVSAHYVLPRAVYKDSDVVHLVKDSDVAYHAGNSQWTVDGKLRKGINSYSVGIELEGDGNLVEYTDFQYENLIQIVRELMNTYRIREENIVGHEDIAPGRKVDPGRLFDWKRFRKGINPPPIIEMPELAITPPEEEAPMFHMEAGEDKKSRIGGLLGGILSLVFKLLGK